MEGKLIEQLEQALWECACARDELERQQQVVAQLPDGALELQPALALLESLKAVVLDKMQLRNAILLQVDLEAIRSPKAASPLHPDGSGQRIRPAVDSSTPECSGLPVGAPAGRAGPAAR